MRSLAAAVRAQVAAEVATRLRSPATLVALLLVFAASILWIPDPAGNASSLSWRTADGRAQAPVYDAAYIGFAAAVLVSIFVPLVGFYLVAGSVRRDRRSGVGAILAATPLSKAAYLAGKCAAHAAYLLVVAGLALAAGLTAWGRFGVGSFSVSGFIVPFLLIALPAIVVTAGMAVLFDVTPGLSGRAGLVLWFFVFLLLIAMIPLTMADVGKGARRPPPIFDPGGAATATWMAAQSVPSTEGLSIGFQVRSEPYERVPWSGVAVTPRLIASRLLDLAIALAPLALAIAIFDRFDPARRGGRLRPRAGAAPAAASQAASPAQTAAAPAPVVVSPARDGARPNAGADTPPRAAALLPGPIVVRPTLPGAVLAEARLIWSDASFLKWPIAGSALLAGVTPGPLAPELLLLLLIPLVSEVAAREDLAGTRALVRSQPAVPASTVLWKAAAVGLVVVVLGAPLALRCLAVSPARGAACMAGLLGLAAVSVGLGSLTSGGKLFSAIALVAWYLALNGMGAADVTGALGGEPSPFAGLVSLLAGGVLVGAAAARERRRA